MQHISHAVFTAAKRIVHFSFCFIIVAPEFTQRLKGEEVVDEGADLILQFRVHGLPQPTLRWFKDDELIGDHQRWKVLEKGDGRYLLTLHHVNKGDEAAYRCRAENMEGASSCCFFLTVKGKANDAEVF